MLAIALSVLAPTASSAAPSPWSLYRQHDFFALHAALLSNPNDRQFVFLRAADAFAYGRYEYASAVLRNLLSRSNADPAPESDIREMLMLSERAGFHYSAALDAVEPLLRSGSDGGAPQLENIRNRVALLAAIEDVPPEVSYPGNGSPQALTSDGMLGVRVEDLPLHLLFDTGANFSLLSRSAARDAGLAVRQTDYRINGAAGTGTRADVASGTIRFGDGTAVSNVVFVVLPDAALRLPDGRALSGAIGFPVISILGAIRHLPNGHIVLARTIGDGSSRTDVALSGSDPLLQIEYRGQRLTCRLDTGAAQTAFYDSFSRAFPGIVANAQRFREQIAGIGGASAVDGYKLSAVRVALAGRDVQLRNVRVLAQSIDADEEGIFCNIGRDVLNRLGQYTMSFTEMSFSLP
jgi:predicted aspartyl protease